MNLLPHNSGTHPYRSGFRRHSAPYRLPYYCAYGSKARKDTTFRSMVDAPECTYASKVEKMRHFLKVGRSFYLEPPVIFRLSLTSGISRILSRIANLSVFRSLSLRTSCFTLQSAPLHNLMRGACNFPSRPKPLSFKTQNCSAFHDVMVH